MSKKFPIVDIQFHREGMAGLRSFDEYTKRERAILTAWHSAAIVSLSYGMTHGLDGPAVVEAGKPRKIEDFLTLSFDSFGQAVFSHSFKV